MRTRMGRTRERRSNLPIRVAAPAQTSVCDLVPRRQVSNAGFGTGSRRRARPRAGPGLPQERVVAVVQVAASRCRRVIGYGRRYMRRYMRIDAAPANRPLRFRLRFEKGSALVNPGEAISLHPERLSGQCRTEALVRVHARQPRADLLGIDPEDALIEPRLVTTERESARTHQHRAGPAPFGRNQSVACRHAADTLLGAHVVGHLV